LPDQFLVRGQSISLVPAEFGRTNAARFAVQPTEAHDRADTHSKLLRSCVSENANLLPKKGIKISSSSELIPTSARYFMASIMA
jgi:hypothetical protein